MNTKCPLLKALYLKNKYNDALWFVKRKKEMYNNSVFWNEVYKEIQKMYSKD